MSCCQRSGAPHIAGQRWASGPATPVPLPQPPARLRFTGARALSLPVGTRRVLALPGEVLEGVAARAAARTEKNWAMADAVRDGLSRRGIQIEDTPQGTRWLYSKRSGEPA